MPAEAQSDQTQVRFLHAVSGAGPASLLVERGGPRLPSAFAKPSGYQVFRPGKTRLRLILNGQSSPVATEVVRLGPGRHTVVAVGGDKGVDLLVYHDDGVEPGQATLRAIHAAGEVGRADVRVDGKVVVTGVGLGDATGYLPLPPGRHSVAVTRPGGEGGALVKANVRAVAGTAATAFVVGSAGMPAQVVLTTDGTAGPTTAPATGLGGADTSGGGWLLILGSSLIGGSLGGATYVLARRTRSRGALKVETAPVSDGPPKPSAVVAGPPKASAVAAGPPVAANVAEDEEAEKAAEAKPAEAPPAEATPAPKPALVTAAAKIPPLPPLPIKPVQAAPADPAANGSPAPEPAEEAGNGSATPLWSPSTGERWTPAPGPTGRFARLEAAEESDDAEGAFDAPQGPRFVHADAEVTAAPAPPAYPLFVRPDPEPTPETEDEAKAPAPVLFDSPPVAPEGPRPLTPWPDPPATPYPPLPAPAAPETNDSWSGSWIAEPKATPEPEAAPEPEAEATPEPPATFAVAADAVEETVVEPEPEIVEGTVEETVEDTVEETVEEAVEVAEEPAAPAAPASTGNGVSTWSSASSRPVSATGSSRAHKVNFLVVSGAALVVTGLVVARRGGRH